MGLSLVNVGGLLFVCSVCGLLLLLVCLSCYRKCSQYLKRIVSQETFLNSSDQTLTSQQGCQTLTSIKVSNAEEGSQSCLRPCCSTLRLEQVHTLLTAPDGPLVPSSKLEMDPTDGLRYEMHPPNTYQESILYRPIF